MAIQLFIIDNADSTRSLMRMILRDSGFQIAGEAGTLHSALQKLPAQAVEMVIVDRDLPDGDGIEFIARLRELLPGVVVVVSSSHSDPAGVHSALQAGAQGYIIKPFTAGALEGTLKQAWKRSAQPAGRAA